MPRKCKLLDSQPCGNDLDPAFGFDLGQAFGRGLEATLSLNQLSRVSQLLKEMGIHLKYCPDETPGGGSGRTD